MTLPELQRQAADWLERFGPRQHTADDQWYGVVEEVGEIAKAQLKRRQEITYGGRSAQDWIEKEKDAIGDLVIFLLNYATARGFSFERCVFEALDEIRKRDFHRFPGNGRDR